MSDRLEAEEVRVVATASAQVRGAARAEAVTALALGSSMPGTHEQCRSVMDGSWTSDRRDRLDGALFLGFFGARSSARLRAAATYSHA